VANTAAVYGAFLKKLKKSAQNIFTMKPASFVYNDQEHEVFNDDIENLIENIEGDVLYLDPPYNHRQYAPNYHLLETIAKYDNPKIKGKTGLRDYSNQKSKFSQKKEVLKSFENLIQKAKVKYIFLSYNNEGLLSPDDIKSVMSQKGSYGVFTKEYGRFKADTDQNRNHKANSVMEYLHYVKCKK
jgi:adenine-specific DNA-methyltransferase